VLGNEPAQFGKGRMKKGQQWDLVSRLLHLEQGKGVSPTYCYTMYNEKALNPVQTWLSDFSAMCHYTKFGLVSEMMIYL